MKDKIKDIIIKYIEGSPVDEIINIIYPWAIHGILLEYNKEKVIENMSKIKAIEEKFNDDYFRLLSIVDHLRECSNIYDEYKLKRCSIDDLDKELTDLFILLNIHISKKDSLYIERIDKFFDKINEKEK